MSMESGKYYVLGYGKTLTESMTKEQIMAAITQAVESHVVSDVDTGFVTKLKEARANKQLTVWIGTTAQYNAIASPTVNCLYILTDDTEYDDLITLIESLTTQLDESVGLKGIEILSQSVAYGTGYTIDLESSHNISEYSVVKVLLGGYNEVLCDVYKYSNSTVKICGTGTADSSGDDGYSTIFTVNLYCNITNNQLTANLSKSTLFDDENDAITITTVNVLKITGVY